MISPEMSISLIVLSTYQLQYCLATGTPSATFVSDGPILECAMPAGTFTTQHWVLHVFAQTQIKLGDYIAR